MKSRLLFLLPFIFFVALWLTSNHALVDHYDSFENLNSARSISNGISLGFTPLRAPFTPLVLALGFVLESWIHVSGLGYAISRTIILFFLFITGFTLYKILIRQRVATQAAWLGATLLCANHLFIHASLLIKEDIPSVALLISGVSFYLQDLLFPAAVLLVSSGFARWNYLPVPGMLMGTHLLELRIQDVRSSLKPMFVVLITLLPSVLALLLMMLIYGWIGRTPWSNTLQASLSDFQKNFSNNWTRTEPMQIYFSTIWDTVTPPNPDRLFSWIRHQRTPTKSRRPAIFSLAYRLWSFTIRCDFA